MMNHATHQARPILGLHHFAWRCKDAEETRRFYEDILGLPLVHVIKKDYVPSTGDFCPYVHIFFRMADGSSLAFFDLGDNVAAEPSRNTPSWVNHIAVRVEGEAELHEMQARLQSYGVDVLGVIDHDGYIHSIYFYDPNGLRVELTTEVAPESVVAAFADQARQDLDTWTHEKAGRREGRHIV